MNRWWWIVLAALAVAGGWAGYRLAADAEPLGDLSGTGSFVQQGTEQAGTAAGDTGALAPITVRRLAPEPAPPAGAPRTRAVALFESLEGGRLPVDLVGRVRDEAAEGVGGAQVQVHEQRGGVPGHPELGPPRQLVETREDGSFAFLGLLRAGSRYAIRVSHPGYATTWVTGIDPLQPATTRQDVRLGLGRSLGGRVRDTRRQVVAGAEVIVSWVDAPGPDSASTGERRTLTGADGTYRLEHLAAGRKVVRVRAAGLETGVRDPVLVTSRADPPDVDFLLGPGRDIAGQVLEAGTGLPVAQAWVRAKPIASGSDQTDAEAAGVSAADGSFRLLGLGERDYILEAGAAGFEVSSRVPARGGAEGVEIALQVLAALAGQVIDAESGEPVTAFTALASPLEELTGIYSGACQTFEGPSGTFELRGVTEGLQHVFVLAPGYAPARSRPLRVGRGEYLGGVEVRLSPGVALTGRILGAEGGPAAGVTCLLVADLPAPQAVEGPRLVRSFRPVRQEARTQEDGSFLFTGVAPGIYTVEVRCEGTLFAPGGSDAFSIAGSGRRELPDLVLRQAAGLEGIVRDHFGRPDAGAVVAIISVDAGRAAQVTAVTDDQGGFQALGLPPGTYRVLLLRSGGETLYRSLTGAGGADTNLTTLVEGVVKRVELGDG